MNTKQELQTAFQEFEAGTFIKTEFYFLASTKRERFSPR